VPKVHSTVGKMYREQVNLHDTSLKCAITEHFGDGKTIATYLSPFQQAFSTKKWVSSFPLVLFHHSFTKKMYGDK